MKKDDLTKDFEDMIKTYPFIYVNDRCERDLRRGPETRVIRQSDRIYLFIEPHDSDETILTNVLKTIEMAQEMQRELAEIDAYKRQNPNLRERLEYIAWSIRK